MPIRFTDEMSLRSYFAAHAPDAPQSWYEGDDRAPQPPQGEDPEEWERYEYERSAWEQIVVAKAARWAWAYADAILAERARTEDD